jgi:hypothetical protein
VKFGDPLAWLLPCKRTEIEAPFSLRSIAPIGSRPNSFHWAGCRIHDLRCCGFAQGQWVPGRTVCQAWVH